MAEDKQKQSEEKLSVPLKQQLQKARRAVLGLSVLSFLLATVAILALGFALRAEFLRQQAKVDEDNAQLHALSTAKAEIFNSNLNLEGLIASLKAGQRLKRARTGKQTLAASQSLDEGELDTRMQIVTALRQMVYGIREQNRLEDHSATVYNVRFSPDGQTIASTSADKTVKLWKRDGTLITSLPGHNELVYGVSFSPDGQTIASGSGDKTVKLWKRDGSLITTLTGHSGAVWDVSFSPDGQIIASTSDDATVKLWKRDGSLITTLTGHKAPVGSVRFSPDGQTIASGSDDATVKLWKRDGSLITTLTGHNREVGSVSFSPDGQIIASSSFDKTVKLWKRDGSLITTLTGIKLRLLASVSARMDRRLPLPVLTKPSNSGSATAL